METMVDVMRQMAALRQSGENWAELFGVSDMSLGLYRLEKGATDPQTPHTEDEIYYVLAGRGRLLVEGRDHPMTPGVLAYVPANAKHRFHDITESLELLVLFAPREGTRG